MKNMKRFLAFGMAACMVMGSMTACGSGKSDSGSSDAATTDSSPSDSSGDNGEVKLKMLVWGIYQQHYTRQLCRLLHHQKVQLYTSAPGRPSKECHYRQSRNLTDRRYRQDNDNADDDKYSGSDILPRNSGSVCPVLPARYPVSSCRS